MYCYCYGLHPELMPVRANLFARQMETPFCIETSPGIWKEGVKGDYLVKEDGDLCIYQKDRINHLQTNGGVNEYRH